MAGTPVPPSDIANYRPGGFNPDAKVDVFASLQGMIENQERNAPAHHNRASAIRSEQPLKRIEGGGASVSTSA